MKKKYNFHYEIMGENKKTTILFLHGFMGSSQDWTDPMVELKDRFRCLAIDLPGHGKTKVLGDENSYTMENTASALIHFLKHLNIRRCILVGYSMGGRLALFCAFSFPLYFPKLIVESASPGLREEKERRERRAHDDALSHKLQHMDFSDFLNEWYTQPLFGPLRNHQGFKDIIRKRVNNKPIELIKSLKGMGTGVQSSLWEKWARNRIPTLLIVGEKDYKFRGIAQQMIRECSVAHLKIIKDSGHTTHFEAKNMFINSIKDFISY
ncbi:MAG: 2-succinyl-6-hydroxy-2,4-cyclohexadiene-1-carboxylate synthase [bacterium]